MSINRVIVVLPVLAGLVLTGTAVARMMPVQTVRDSVYQNSTGQQTCAHNGVHFNKQGHANCGLHKGWSDQGSTEGSTRCAPATPATRLTHGAKRVPAQLRRPRWVFLLRPQRRCSFPN